METKIADFWQLFLQQTGRPKTEKYYGISDYGTGAFAQRLVGLILEGKKKATTSLSLEYELLQEIKQKVGDLEIIVDEKQNPRAVVEITSVQEMQFKEMTEHLALKEGEDDNLEQWRKNHIAFFTNLCQSYQIEFKDELLIYFQEFKVIYQI